MEPMRAGGVTSIFVLLVQDTQCPVELDDVFKFRHWPTPRGTLEGRHDATIREKPRCLLHHEPKRGGGAHRERGWDYQGLLLRDDAYYEAVAETSQAQFWAVTKKAVP